MHSLLHFVVFNGQRPDSLLCGKVSEVLAHSHDLLVLCHNQLQVVAEAQHQSVRICEHTTSKQYSISSYSMLLKLKENTFETKSINGI